MMLDAALGYARRGIPIFPCRGKKPLTEHGFHDASSDEVQIREWWSKWPKANIGIPTGRVSGLFVLDIDGDVGQETLKALEAKHGALPRTKTIITSPGHLQFWYRQAPVGTRSTAGVLGRGLDTRADGGYVIAPPSIHPGTRRPYIVSHIAEPEPAPAWLIELTMRKGNGAATSAKEAPGTIREGARNSTLASLAGTMRKRGMSPAAILAALREHNREHCDPPLPEKEVEVIAGSVGRYPTADAPGASVSSAQSDDEGSLFQGDQANAERLASDYEGKLIYLADRQVRCAWDGHRWRLGYDGSWGRAAIETVRQLYLAAASELDSYSRERMAKRAIKAEGRTAQMMTLAQVSTKIEKLKFSETFNLDHLLVNVANGILDLTTGRLEPHRADALLKKITGIPYVSNAKCSMFEKFLANTFDGNHELIEYMTRFMGYVLSGITKEQAFWFFYGPKGATSKSTFVKLLRLLAGEYATTLPGQALIVDRNKNQDYGLAELAGVRLATAVEIGQGRRLDSAMVKQITGQDPIKACRKYENYFEFRSAAKLVIATNHRPIIRETSDAIWRRVKSVPSLVVVPEKARIDNLEEKLVEAEGPGILAFAVRGFQNYLANGFQEPREISAAIEEYRRSEDVVSRFVDEHCVVDVEARVAYGALYSKFIEIAKANGEHHMPSDTFAKELERLGYNHAKSGSVRYRLGLCLRDLYESEPSP